MGREATCSARIGRTAAEGKLLLETDDLIFRGQPRLAVPLRSISSAQAKDGWLEILHEGGKARFELGDAAAKWAHAINNPRTRIDKLEVKAGSNVGVIDIEDAEFLSELEARTGEAPDPATRRDYDLIFLGVEKPAALRRLSSLAKRIVPAGAIWVITPKGVPAVGREPVISAAKDAGLVDVKSARFSETHTGLKLVIPRERRRLRH